MSNKNRTSLGKPTILIKFNDHVMGNQKVACDEMRDDESIDYSKEMEKVIEDSIDNNECNVSFSDLSKHDEISKSDDRTQEVNDNDNFVNEANIKNRDESCHKPKSYANAVQKNVIQLDTSLDFTPTVISEDGSEFVIFDEKIGRYGLIDAQMDRHGTCYFKFRNHKGMEEVLAKGHGLAKYANVLVEFDVNKGFKDEICMHYRSKDNVVRGTKKVKVEYTWKQDLCTQCRVFGYSDSKCGKVQRSTEERIQETVNSKENNVQGWFFEVRYKRNNKIGKNAQKWSIQDTIEDALKKSPNKFVALEIMNKKEELNMLKDRIIEHDRMKEIYDMNEKNEDVLEGENVAAKKCSANNVIGMDSSIFVYASNSGIERIYMWNEVSAAKIVANDNPRYLLGYFNPTLKAEEHSCGGSYINGEMQDFIDCINDLEVEDISSN
ncbi:hypothetical protein Tco_0233621, partial [Tanacetum coccineum]